MTNLHYSNTTLLFVIIVIFISVAETRTLSSHGPTNTTALKELSSTFLVATSKTNIGINLHVNKVVVREQAIEKLLQVFGLENNTMTNGIGGTGTMGGQRRPRPPPFMLKLYNSVADSTSGITRAPNPYNANTVRAFQNKALKQRMRFDFNLSRVSSEEELLHAELHLFKLKPKRYSRRDPKTQTHYQCFVWLVDVSSEEELLHAELHLFKLKPKRYSRRDPKTQTHYQVHLYQLFGDADSSAESARLIGVRLISAARMGWEVFSITDAARSWLEDESTNRGIYICVTTLTGEPIEDGLIRFAQRGKHYETRQPILVLFTDDVTRKPTPRTTFDEETPDYNSDHSVKNGNVDWVEINSASSGSENATQFSSQNVRTKRHQNYKTDTSRHSIKRRAAEHTIPKPPENAASKEILSCQRESMYVDFEQIGWSSWVISPNGYNAFHCTGTCPFPLSLNQKPTNHATVQSIMNTLNLGENVALPCCVPNELNAISLLYFDNDGNVILKQYAGMVAASCGCH